MIETLDEKDPFVESSVDVPFRRVLVLNRNWQAVNIIGVRRAFSLLWQEHARVINTFDGDFLPMSAGEWVEYLSLIHI